MKGFVKMIEIGMTYREELIVEEINTARVVGSGTVDVFATPQMIMLMEKAAYKCIANEIGKENTSVGTVMNVKHLSATPVGMSVYAVATVTEVNGRRVVFNVEAYDSVCKIGEGTHERFVVNAEKFQQKTNSKNN